jgi:hypothetical protein
MACFRIALLFTLFYTAREQFKGKCEEYMVLERIELCGKDIVFL